MYDSVKKVFWYPNFSYSPSDDITSALLFCNKRQSLVSLLNGITFLGFWPAYFDTKEDLLQYIRMCHELGIVG